MKRRSFRATTVTGERCTLCSGRGRCRGVTITGRLPECLSLRLDELAQAEGVSLNGLVIRLLSQRFAPDLTPPAVPQPKISPSE